MSRERDTKTLTCPGVKPDKSIAVAGGVDAEEPVPRRWGKRELFKRAFFIQILHLIFTPDDGVFFRAKNIPILIVIQSKQKGLRHLYRSPQKLIVNVITPALARN